MIMPNLYHVLSLREPVFIRPAELSGIQQVFFIKMIANGFNFFYNLFNAGTQF